MGLPHTPSTLTLYPPLLVTCLQFVKLMLFDFYKQFKAYSYIVFLYVRLSCFQIATDISDERDVSFKDKHTSFMEYTTTPPYWNMTIKQRQKVRS